MKRAAAFTLLEIMLAMLVLSLMVAGIFAIVSGTVQLTDEMTLTQDGDAKVHGLHRMLERFFLNLPGESQVRYRTKQSGSHYLGQLAVSHAPQVFGLERNVGTGLTVLETQEVRGGYLRLVMRWFTEEQAAAWESGRDDATSASLVLFDNITALEWRFFNPLSKEWEPVLNENLSFIASSTDKPTDPPPTSTNLQAQANGATQPIQPNAVRRPGLVELRISLSAGKSERHLFWVPPVTPQPKNAVPQPVPSGAVANHEKLGAINP